MITCREVDKATFYFMHIPLVGSNKQKPNIKAK